MIREKDLTTKILYVEDDQDIRGNIEKLLRRRYQQVEFARDGREGLDLYHSFSPDIIVTDILMPKMSGLEMSKEIRKSNNEVPIIVTTAHSDSDNLMDAISAGINHYIVKPIDIEKLLNAIKKERKILSIEKELNDARELFSSITEASVSGIFVFEDKFTYSNEQFQSITGYSNEELQEMGFCDLFYDDFQSKAKTIKEKMTSNESMEENYFEARIKTKTNLEKWLYFAVNTIEHNNRYVGTGSAVDITEIKYLQKELKRKATYDNLTGAVNRQSFEEVYQKEINRADRYGTKTSILFLDIDHFKLINDKFGHLTGDYVLKELTKLIKSHLRSPDTYVRWGGEEFIIFAPETDEEGSKKLADKIRDRVENYHFDTVENLTISIGVATRKENEPMEKLINRADKNLYKAKEGGRNRVAAE